MLAGFHPGHALPLTLFFSNLDKQLPDGNHEFIAFLHTEFNGKKLLILIDHRVTIDFQLISQRYQLMPETVFL